MEYSNGIANFIPRHLVGSRFSLCLFAKVIAWPLIFWIVATFIGEGLEPNPMEIESGIGDRKWEASSSLLIILSLIKAQPAVFIKETLRPCFL